MVLFCSTSESSFDTRHDDFAPYCRDMSPDLLEYFDKNWMSCRDMWFNYARSTNFYGGNTTTHIIEANWKQLKMRLGYKPRIDRTIAGLICHQVSMLRQFSTVLRSHATRSRQPTLVPEFLRLVASQLSDYALAKVMQQWDYLFTTMDDWLCN